MIWHGSLHNATINITGRVSNGKGNLKVSIYDYYDFDYTSNYFKGIKGFAFAIGNNMAWSDQYFGVINNYHIYIDFDYKW